jgi:hypothetical protein
MICECVERIKQHNFEACCPEHQLVMDLFHEKLEAVVREATYRAIIKLSREILDDELVLNEEIIIGKE